MSTVKMLMAKIPRTLYNECSNRDIVIIREEIHVTHLYISDSKCTINIV